ncbi:nodulation protein NfeD [Herbaspirillum sp. GCM10030257]|uniref:NfeD family protein n=1 Tax=Herbaspirillum sp. GCM10030257 TaxID=3273393 RepID=UPI0036187A3B
MYLEAKTVDGASAATRVSRWSLYVARCWFIALGMFWACQVASAGLPASVSLLTVDDAIGPATADYIIRGIARAEKEEQQLVILKLDTPGGLDVSMRSIVKAILGSSVPIATFVAPGGARAASAGTYILYASHIAAMAPGTNLGAATPVQLGGTEARDPDKSDNRGAGKPGTGASDSDTETDKKATGGSELASSMMRKQVNDAVAYIRGLAQMRGRNAEWAEHAVREAVSLPAEEAVKLRVVDYVAEDVPALLAQIDGKEVTAGGQPRTLHTAGASVIDAQPDWRIKILSAITNPSIALLLLTLGVYGIIFELMSPGSGVPGVVGTLLLLIGLYALQLLPVNYAGLALILLGLAFMVAEVFLPSFGIIGAGGIGAFIIGALLLIDTDVPGYGIPFTVIAGIAVVSALALVGIATLAVKTRRLSAPRNPDRIVGSVAEVIDADVAANEAWAQIHGEIWRVVSTVPLHRSQKVRVVARTGLTLEVVPAGHPEKGE